MYPQNNLYSIYKKNVHEKNFSPRIPDVTNKRTLDFMNLAINCCENWGSSLDIGGGSGHYTAPLLFKFKNAVVVDVAKYEEHEYLKKRYQNFEYHNKFIEQIEFKEKFDFILLADIFEHIVDINLFIEQVSELQNKGGVVYILTPNPLFCGPANQSEIFYTKHLDGHQKHYLKIEVENIMKQHAYELVYFGYEESIIRQKVRRYIRGFSRRDELLSNKFFIYKKIIAPMLSLGYSSILFFVEYLVHNVEYKNKNNAELMLSAAYIFKKIY